MKDRFPPIIFFSSLGDLPRDLANIIEFTHDLKKIEIFHKNSNKIG